jgi:competence protein ComEA
VLLVSRPSAQPVPRLHRTVTEPPLGDPSASTAATAPSTASAVLVDVTGAVRRPGVVQLPSGARVTDAIDAAGGPAARADLASVNLARPVADGEQIVVARRGAQLPGPVPAATSATSGAPTAPLDLNTATEPDLESLPGVGPVLAQRVLDWRAQHGPFSSVDELTEVSGIGPATLADLRPLVRV